MMDSDYKIKTIIIGDCGVGKSCIITKFIDDEFISKYNTTIGVDFKTYRLNYLNSEFKLYIWDTAGQERFKAITKSFYKGVDVVLICFDLTNIYSYNNIDLWLKEINKEKLINPIIILVGTKADLDKSRAIGKEEAQEKAKLLNFYAYYETSAKNNVGINDIFNDIIKAYCLLNNINSVKKKETIQINQDTNSTNIKLENQTFESKMFKIFSYFICY